jgi:hypothetical protein
MHPQNDDFPPHIERAVQALINHDGAAAGKALEPIAYPRRELARRPQIARRIRCDVFKRDHFTCRYCGGTTILTPVMELLSLRYPDIFPFESDAWKGGRTHPAFAARSPMVDHIEPVSQGGHPHNMENLATACNPCNATKADFTLKQLGWTLLPVPGAPWDGLVGYYRNLWTALGRPDAARHEAWFRDLSLV